MGLVRLLGDGCHFHFRKARFLEETVKHALLEAQPNVRIQFARLFESMLVEVEDDELAARAEDTERFVDRGLRVTRVMERLGQDREVHRFVAERDLFDVAEFVGQIGEAITSGEVGAHLDHPRRIIDAPNLARSMRE